MYAMELNGSHVKRTLKVPYRRKSWPKSKPTRDLVLYARQIRHDMDGQVYILHNSILTDAAWEQYPNAERHHYSDFRESTKLAPDQEVEVL
jgi:hypothetical protein